MNVFSRQGRQSAGGTDGRLIVTGRTISQSNGGGVSEEKMPRGKRTKGKACPIPKTYIWQLHVRAFRVDKASTIKRLELRELLGPT